MPGSASSAGVRSSAADCRWLPGWRAFWQIAMVFLIAGAALFTITGTWGKIRDRWIVEAPRELDSMSYMQYAYYDDFGQRLLLALQLTLELANAPVLCRRATTLALLALVQRVGRCFERLLTPQLELLTMQPRAAQEGTELLLRHRGGVEDGLETFLRGPVLRSLARWGALSGAHGLEPSGLPQPPRQRRLRGQRRPVHRIAIEQQLVRRVVHQPRRVVAVGIATGDRKYPLTNQIVHAVRNLARLPLVAKAGGNALRQAQALIACFEQDRAAIGTALRLIEARNQRLIEQLGKQYRLFCAIVFHAKASSLVDSFVSQRRFVPVCEAFVIQFMNNPG